MERAAVFDVDGTLVDTNHLHVVTRWEAFRQAGHRVPMAAEPAEPEELRHHPQDSLRDHATRGAAHTAVLGTLLLQAENLWAELLPAARGDTDHRGLRQSGEHPLVVRR
jgi:phosphoglycolate phosphatase-like HAD superfamily hydrolase